MDYEIIKLREKYGEGAYATVIDEHIIIPWKPLCITDFITYQNPSIYPAAAIEDEIFRKCVLDQSWIRQIDFLPAGIVSTVAANILSVSGPDNPETIQDKLIEKRNKVNGTHQIIYDFIKLITIAFPYKPEELFTFDFDKLIEILVLAENKLLTIGFLQEPIAIEGAQQPQEQPFQRPRVDAKELWESQYNKRSAASQSGSIDQLKDAYDPKKGISPVLTFGNKHGIDFKKEQHDYMPENNWDRVEMPQKQRQMVEDAKVIYKDLLEELAKKKRK